MSWKSDLHCLLHEVSYDRSRAADKVNAVAFCSSDFSSPPAD